MGSMGSRMGGEVERLPAKIFPLFRRRNEEITKRRNVCMPLLGGATPSKKMLLNEDPESVEQSESFASNCPQKERMAEEENVKPAVEPLAIEDEGDSQGELVDNENKDANNESLDEEERKGEGEQREEEDEEDEEKMKKNKEDNHPWPASPSFRIYCVAPLADDNDDDGKTNSFNSQTDESHETDASKDSKGSGESVVSRVSSEGSGTRRVKKHKKGRRLRRVLPKGRPVRKLLNMQSCYYLSCSSSDRTHLLTEKNVVA